MKSITMGFTALNIAVMCTSYQFGFPKKYYSEDITFKAVGTFFSRQEFVIQECSQY